MKNKYIYILLAFVCFFGFNASVNADYKKTVLNGMSFL